MAANTGNNSEKDWTLLFYFGSDNELSPLIVSQIKELKAAPGKPNVDVLVYFDPQERGAPTKVYDVNRHSKNGRSRHSDRNPFVHNMLDDEIDDQDLAPKMKAVMKDADHQPAAKTLRAFIEEAVENHSAKNYILILCGHGQAVGSDTFLPDAHPRSAVGLAEMKDMLVEGFPKGTLRLVAMHSCSMSSIEVAYELRGAANYLLATQGISYIGCWPFRQMILEVQNNAGAHTPAEISELIKNLYFFSLFNGTDYMTAGYSADVALCNLDPAGMTRLKEAFEPLISSLAKSFDDKTIGPTVRDLVLLAHLRAQSFYEENYTDLYDFCFCLRQLCSERATTDEEPFKSICQACDKVIGILNPQQSSLDSVVVAADNFGWRYQYAHGLSIYFPWSEPLDIERTTDTVRPSRTGGTRAVNRRAGDIPLEERSERILEIYGSYEFSKAFGWLDFLRAYWTVTQRKSRYEEDDKLRESRADLSYDLAIADSSFRNLIGNKEFNQFVNSEFNFVGALQKGSPELSKGSPEIGAACSCPSIKNYPTGVWRDKTVPFLFMTPGAGRVFRNYWEERRPK